MSQMDTLITIHGSEYDIYRESKGSVDSYGDRAVTWTKYKTEKAVIQEASLGRSQIVNTAAGKISDKNHVGFFKSNSVIQSGDYITDGTTKWDAVQVETIKTFGVTSHKEVLLRIMQG